MKNNLIKRLLIVAETILLICSVICLVSCKKKDDGGSGNTDAPKYEISVSPEAVSVFEFEYVNLTATVAGSDGTVVWSSSDNSVATVNENGKVYGVKQGTAEITAKIGEGERCVLSADCMLPCARDSPLL